jgi:hypothetical protein
MEAGMVCANCFQKVATVVKSFFDICGSKKHPTKMCVRERKSGGREVHKRTRRNQRNASIMWNEKEERINRILLEYKKRVHRLSNGMKKDGIKWN